MPIEHSETMQLLTIDDLASRWQVKKQTLYNRLSTGAPMPRSVKLGDERIRRFRLEDVESWELDRLEETTIG